MTRRGEQSPVPRVALRVGEAAESLGVSEDFFAGYVKPELRWIRKGSLKLVALSELQRWAELNSSRILGDEE
jgi:hypothetical protein